MNLLQLRKKFRDLSGRNDLVNDDGSDNGANFYIHEGQKYLDRQDETQKSWASAFRFIELARYSASIPFCRGIKEVWASNTTARWKLEKIDLQDLIGEYLMGDPSARNTGSPLYYSPTITRFIPEGTQIEDFESYLQWVEIPAGPSHEYNSILINVPTSVRLVVEVKGLFYTAELVADADENHWSVNHSLLLITATMRQTEVVNKNPRGIKILSEIITGDMMDLGKDLVEEIIADVKVMKG